MFGRLCEIEAKYKNNPNLKLDFIEIIMAISDCTFMNIKGIKESREIANSEICILIDLIISRLDSKKDCLLISYLNELKNKNFLDIEMSRTMQSLIVTVTSEYYSIINGVSEEHIINGKIGKIIEKARIICNGTEQIDGTILRMMDVIESKASILKNNISMRDQWNYIMIKSLYPYIWENKRELVEKLKEDHTLIQALIMLGCNVPFDEVLDFICDSEERTSIDDVINMIAYFSKRGIEFFRFYKRETTSKHEDKIKEIEEETDKAFISQYFDGFLPQSKKCILVMAPLENKNKSFTYIIGDDRIEVKNDENELVDSLKKVCDDPRLDACDKEKSFLEAGKIGADRGYVVISGVINGNDDTIKAFIPEKISDFQRKTLLDIHRDIAECRRTQKENPVVDDFLDKIYEAVRLSDLGYLLKK